MELKSIAYKVYLSWKHKAAYVEFGNLIFSFSDGIAIYVNGLYDCTYKPDPKDKEESIVWELEIILMLIGEDKIRLEQ